MTVNRNLCQFMLTLTLGVWAFLIAELNTHSPGLGVREAGGGPRGRRGCLVGRRWASRLETMHVTHQMAATSLLVIKPPTRNMGKGILGKESSPANLIHERSPPPLFLTALQASHPLKFPSSLRAASVICRDLSLGSIFLWATHTALRHGPWVAVFRRVNEV